MPLQVQKGKFVVMAACAASGALAFSLAGEQLWLGRVEHRGQDSLKLHYYQQPCARLGKSLNLSSPSSMLDVLSVIIIVRCPTKRARWVCLRQKVAIVYYLVGLARTKH